MYDIKISRKMERVFFTRKPIVVLISGRGAGKSIGLGDILTYRMATEGADVYCLREFQDSISDSVHRVFEGSVKERLKLEGWDIQKNAIIAPNGARTTYKGANRNPDSIQSAQGYKYCWFEEAHRASQDSIDKLLPTILRNQGAQCFFSANPQSSADPFSQRFINPFQKQLDAKGFYEDEIHLIVKLHYTDNPWWNKELEQQRQYDFDHLDRAKYRWIWEGDFNDSVELAVIKSEWFDAAIDAFDKLNITPTGGRVSAFDPSDKGTDAKGFASRIGWYFDDVCEIDVADGNDAADEGCRKARELGTDRFIYDADGMGALLRRQIRSNFVNTNVDVEEFSGASEVQYPNEVYEGLMSEKGKTNKQLFYNRRAQCYIRLAKRFYNTWLAVERGKYINPDDMISINGKLEHLKQLRAELCRIPQKPNDTGKIQIMPKTQMKNKLGIESPNMADSMMMTEQQSTNLNIEIAPDLQMESFF